MNRVHTYFSLYGLNIFYLDHTDPELFMKVCKLEPYIIDIIIFRLVYFIAQIW